MPVISRFFGIVVAIYWNDHSPPHFHARYGGQEVTVEIESGKAEGSFSERALAMIQRWREMHKSELMNNWNRAKERKFLLAIEPLE